MSPKKTFLSHVGDVAKDFITVMSETKSVIERCPTEEADSEADSDADQADDQVSLDQPMPKQPKALVQQETITQILMFGLERGSILTSWLKLTRHVISMAHLELREALVTAFLKRNKKIRDSFRPVVQNLCTNYLSGVDQIMYADVPYMAPCDEEEPLGALGETVEL